MGGAGQTATSDEALAGVTTELIVQMASLLSGTALARCQPRQFTEADARYPDGFRCDVRPHQPTHMLNASPTVTELLSLPGVDHRAVFFLHGRVEVEPLQVRRLEDLATDPACRGPPERRLGRCVDATAMLGVRRTHPRWGRLCLRVGSLLFGPPISRRHRNGREIIGYRGTEAPRRWRRRFLCWRMTWSRVGVSCQSLLVCRW